MINPKNVCLFIPPNLRNFKFNLFEGIGRKIEKAGGRIIRYDYDGVIKLPDEMIPIVGVSPEFRRQFAEWKARGRNFIYWDRGYLRRVFATWLPRAPTREQSYYRWHLNCFQMETIRDVPGDRWEALRKPQRPGDTAIVVKPWRKGGSKIVIADTGHDYWDVFADREWVKRTVAQLRQYTDRPIVVRDKESKVPLDQHLLNAHALVSHGSIAAVESVVMGCPVFVDKLSAAALVGETDFSKIETPVYPDREKWLRSLAYHQWNEFELVDGTLWRQLT